MHYVQLVCKAFYNDVVPQAMMRTNNFPKINIYSYLMERGEKLNY